MTKILLIGKNGQLGQYIVKDAPSFGFDIIGLGRDELDVLDYEGATEKIESIKPDILINTSAFHVVSRCEESPSEAMAVNFIAVRNLAKICKERNIVFVTYSTDYVFDGEKGAPYAEDDLPNPLQIYGLSKLAGEYAVLNIYPENSIIIRTCGLYGGESGSPGKGGNFVLNIMKDVYNKEKLEISSEQIVSPTYAGDLSCATLKLLSSRFDPGIYHLVNKGYCSWYEFAQEIFKLAGITTKLAPVDRNGKSGEVKRPRFSALKNAKAKALGIELPSWREGLKSYINFLNLPR